MNLSALPTESSKGDQISTVAPPSEDFSDSGVIRCICGFTEDDGFTIQCEKCLVWQHTVCVNIDNEDQVPEHYYCEKCDPRELDQERAKDLQKRNFMGLISGGSRNGSPPKARKRGGNKAGSGNDQEKANGEKSSGPGTTRNGNKKRRSNVVKNQASSQNSSKRSQSERDRSGTNARLNGQSNSASVVATQNGTQNSTTPIVSNTRSETFPAMAEPGWSDRQNPDVSEHSSDDVGGDNEYGYGPGMKLSEVLVPEYDIFKKTKHEELEESKWPSSTGAGPLQEIAQLLSAALFSIEDALSDSHTPDASPSQTSSNLAQLISSVEKSRIVTMDQRALLTAGKQGKPQKMEKSLCQYLVFPNDCKRINSDGGVGWVRHVDADDASQTMNAARDRQVLVSVAPLVPNQFVMEVAGDLSYNATLDNSDRPSRASRSSTNDINVPSGPLFHKVPQLPLVVDMTSRSNEARYMRRGCSGNSRLCTILLSDEEARTSPSPDPPQIRLGLFAERDVPEGDEVCLRWTSAELGALKNATFQALVQSSDGSAVSSKNGDAMAVDDNKPTQCIYLECATCAASEYSTCLLYSMLSRNPNIVAIPYDTDLCPTFGNGRASRLSRWKAKRKRGTSDKDAPMVNGVTNGSSKAKPLKRLSVNTMDSKGTSPLASGGRSKRGTHHTSSCENGRKCGCQTAPVDGLGILESCGWSGSPGEFGAGRTRATLGFTFFEAMESAYKMAMYDGPQSKKIRRRPPTSEGDSEVADEETRTSKREAQPSDTSPSWSPSRENAENKQLTPNASQSSKRHLSDVEETEEDDQPRKKVRRTRVLVHNDQVQIKKVQILTVSRPVEEKSRPKFRGRRDGAVMGLKRSLGREYEKQKGIQNNEEKLVADIKKEEIKRPALQTTTKNTHTEDTKDPHSGKPSSAKENETGLDKDFPQSSEPQVKKPEDKLQATAKLPAAPLASPSSSPKSGSEKTQVVKKFSLSELKARHAETAKVKEEAAGRSSQLKAGSASPHPVASTGRSPGSQSPFKKTDADMPTSANHLQTESRQSSLGMDIGGLSSPVLSSGGSTKPDELDLGGSSSPHTSQDKSEPLSTDASGKASDKPNGTLSSNEKGTAGSKQQATQAKDSVKKTKLTLKDYKKRMGSKPVRSNTSPNIVTNQNQGSVDSGLASAASPTAPNSLHKIFTYSDVRRSSAIELDQDKGTPQDLNSNGVPPTTNGATYTPLVIEAHPDEPEDVVLKREIQRQREKERQRDREKFNDYFPVYSMDSEGGLGEDGLSDSDSDVEMDTAIV